MRTSVEAARGCGYRKQGGLYLVAPALSEPCERLPVLIERCPCCGQGIKPARGWTWIDPRSFAPATVHGSDRHNATCPLGINEALVGTPAEAAFHRTLDRNDRAGLIWIGEAFYKTPRDFIEEAAAMGISRRIVAVPRGFEIGLTWVYLGHRKAGKRQDEADGIVDVPGIVTLFRPTAVEYVLRDGEENDEALLASLEERGIEAVKVIRADETTPLDLDGDDSDE